MQKENKKGKSHGTKRIKLAELRREVKYSKNSLRGAEKEWKQLCAKITLPKLRDELIMSWHSFEKVMDIKDFIISLYMDEVRNHEDAYMLNFGNHQNNIGNLMEEFSTKLHEIHQENNENLKNLIRESLADWNQQGFVSEEADNYLKIMSFGLEMLRKNYEKYTKTEYFARLNEESTRYAHDVQHLSSFLEFKLEDLWNKIRQTQDDYFHHTSENRKRHDAIKEVDDANNKTVQRELKRLINLQELIKRLTAKFKDLVGTIGEKLEYQESEKETLNECFFALRYKLKQDRDSDAMKRTLITVEFVKSFDYLKGKLKDGERMIKILRVCRRHEMIHEKIMPYPCEDGGMDIDPDSLPQLRLFWQRVAQIQATRYALNEERLYLMRENQKLKRNIHRYCECLDCPVLPPIPSRVGRVPYTEGRDMVRKIETHKGRKNRTSKQEDKNGKRESINDESFGNRRSTNGKS